MKTAVFAYLCTLLPAWSMALSTPKPPHLSPTSLRADALPSLLDRAQCTDKRDQPDSFWSTVEGAASGSYEVQFTVGFGTSVYAWCNVMALRRQQPQDQGCAYWGLGVTSSLYSLFAAVKSVQGWTGTSTTDKRDGIGAEQSFADLMASAYADDGLSFDTIVPSFQAGASRLALNGTTVGVVQKLSILGVRAPGGGDDGVLHDHSITVLSDGSGYLSSQPVIVGTNTTTGELQRRHDGPGLKYNWKIFDYASNVLGSPDLSAAQPVAQHMGQDYVSRADADRSMSEYIATVAFDGAYSMGIRIIPETDGFGENYEDVNLCGDLTGRAHDELR